MVYPIRKKAKEDMRKWTQNPQSGKREAAHKQVIPYSRQNQA